MDATISSVKAFHDAFDIQTPATPQLPPISAEVKEWLGTFATQMEFLGEQLHKAAELTGKNVLLLRLQLMQEELGEFARALHEENLKEAFDALADLRYVNDGSVLTLGLQDVFQQGFDEVQRSNMSKLENGKPLKNEAGRIMKGSNYTKPDLQKVLDGLLPADGE